MTKIEVFPQQVHSTGNVGNTAARTQSHGQEGCSCSAMEVLLRKLPSLSETRGKLGQVALALPSFALSSKPGINKLMSPPQRKKWPTYIYIYIKDFTIIY